MFIFLFFLNILMSERVRQIYYFHTQNSSNFQVGALKYIIYKVAYLSVFKIFYKNIGPRSPYTFIWIHFSFETWSMLEVCFKCIKQTGTLKKMFT